MTLQAKIREIQVSMPKEIDYPWIFFESLLSEERIQDSWNSINQRFGGLADVASFRKKNKRIIRDSEISNFVDNDLPRFHRTIFLVYAFSVFEGYMANLISEILRAHPNVTNDEKLNLASNLEEGIESYLYGLFHKQEFEFAANVKLITNYEMKENEIAEFTEIKATRNVLVHNRGVVHKKYQRKCGGSARGRLNETIPLTRSYINGAIELLKNINYECCIKSQVKYC